MVCKKNGFTRSLNLLIKVNVNALARADYAIRTFQILFLAFNRQENNSYKRWKDLQRANKTNKGIIFLKSARAAEMCVSTVRLLMPSRVAISALDNPSSRLIKNIRRRCSGICPISCITICLNSS